MNLMYFISCAIAGETPPRNRHERRALDAKLRADEKIARVEKPIDLHDKWVGFLSACQEQYPI